MRRFARAVEALNHDAAVEGEPRKDRQRRIGIEDVRRVEVGHALIGDRKGGHLEIDIDAEQAARIDVHVGRGHRSGRVVVGVRCVAVGV